METHAMDAITKLTASMEVIETVVSSMKNTLAAVDERTRTTETPIEAYAREMCEGLEKDLKGDKYATGFDINVPVWIQSASRRGYDVGKLVECMQYYVMDLGDRDIRSKIVGIFNSALIELNYRLRIKDNHALDLARIRLPNELEYRRTKGREIRKFTGDIADIKFRINALETGYQALKDRLTTLERRGLP